MKTVANGELYGLSLTGKPVFVNSPPHDAALSPLPLYPVARKGLRRFGRPAAALSVRSRDVQGATVTRQVALEPRMEASRTLALSR